MMKKILLKLFNLKELWEEIQKREYLFVPPQINKDIDEEKLFLNLKRQFPHLIDYLKVKEYNLTRDIFSDYNFTNGRRFELRSLVSKLEGSTEVLSTEEQKQRLKLFEKIDEGLKEIQKKITGMK